MLPCAGGSLVAGKGRAEPPSLLARRPRAAGRVIRELQQAGWLEAIPVSRWDSHQFTQ